MKHLPQVREAVIDGQKISYTVAGKGAPAIVLINGAGGPLEGWYKLYPDIEKLGTVVAYDRPGVGRSPRATKPQTGRAVVSDLRRLLQEAGVKPPYLLVAHSFGGLHANLFARLHADEVSGVVFVEATAPEDVGTMKEHQSGAQRVINGLLNAFAKPDPNGEVEHEKQTVDEIAAASPFPPVPVIVLSGGKTPPGWMSSLEGLAHRDRHQRALAELSPRGERMVASGSGHFPQMSEPEVVLEAIRKAVDAIRR